MEKRIRDRDRYEKDVERTVRNTSLGLNWLLPYITVCKENTEEEREEQKDIMMSSIW